MKHPMKHTKSSKHFCKNPSLCRSCLAFLKNYKTLQVYDIICNILFHDYIQILLSHIFDKTSMSVIVNKT